MAKILVTYGVPMEGFSALSEHELVAPPPLQSYSKAELIRQIADADAVVACTTLDEEMIEAGKKLKLIVCYGAGYDAIDVKAATRLGVMVCNTPECVTASTAELAVALMMALAKRLPELDRLSRQTPDAFGMGKRMGTSLDGQALGIVGMGRIGSRVADIGRAMGMHVLYASPHAKPERERLGNETVTLDELMARADFVSLHCPLTPDTRGLISRQRLALMKPTAFLINTARGAIVDDNALIDALQSRRIAGAGLDVFCDEPTIPPALLTLDNVLLSPHVGSNTVEARAQMAQAARARILDVLGGQVPQSLLNPEVLR